MDLLHALDKTRDETLGYFDLGPDRLSRCYGPGKWSVREILHHLADAETVMAERVRRILSEGRRVLWAFDQEAWARGLDYPTMPLELSRDIYRSTRAGTRYLAARHYLKDGHLEWVHSETGVRTLRDELDKVAAHNEHHLEQIRSALAG
ncbi:MAG TPA: DinB family protein [Gemmatimonadales bacterium]|nr:DinB family protein [Gemmatimonadales bacterium]